MRRIAIQETVVLLVEDDANAARELIRQLGIAHARCVIARTVDEARTQIDDPSQLFTGIIAEVRLGDRAYGGAEVLEYGRIVRPDARALAMTGRGRTRELNERIGRLNIPFYDKPVDQSVILTFVRESATKLGSERSRRNAVVDRIGDIVGLTDAEREALFHLSYGLSAAQIAARMLIEESTTRGYLEEIRRKLGLHSTSAILGRFIAEIFRSL